MTAKDFGDTYLRYQESIKKVLNSKKIYDEDLLHDTYIALYEHSQHTEIRDYTNAFVAFYRTRHKRRREYENHYEACDDEQILAYDRPDESDLEYRERVGQRVDRLVRWYVAHPQPGERNHKRACKILQLHLQGLTECEISYTLKISQQAVNQSLERTIERLKGCSEMATI